MKYKLAITPAPVTALTVAALAVHTARSLEAYGPAAGDNVVLKWNEQLLGTIRANPPSTGPTITSRALGILQTAEFDAWAAYDPVATGTRLGSQLRRPAAERTAANKDKAIMADQAGMSRRYGGIHFESGDQRGRTLGALTGLDVWQTAQEYFAGTPG